MNGLKASPSPIRALIASLPAALVTLALLALPFLRQAFPGGWAPLSNEAIALYFLLLLSFAYVTYAYVIRAWFAVLLFDGNRIAYRGLGEQREILLADIADLDYDVRTERSRRLQRQNALYLLRTGATEADTWQIGSGWEDAALRNFVETVRGALRKRGQKRFPLREAGFFGSAKPE